MLLDDGDRAVQRLTVDGQGEYQPEVQAAPAPAGCFSRRAETIPLLITARTTSARSLAQTRTYRTCSARMAHPPLPTLRLAPAARS